MRALLRAWLVSGFVLPCVAQAETHEFTAMADLRAVAVDSPYTSFTEGGLGLLRFDEAHDGLRLGSLMLDITGPLSETIRYTATAYATGDGDRHLLDLTEAYLEWRPYPKHALRWRTRVGAFYPTLSLENRNVGWQSPYSISASAINSWIGEEFRIIGAETSVTLAGAPGGRGFDVSLFGSVYGWNDPAGILIFQRGWAIHDRQTPLFGHLPRPFPGNDGVNDMEFFDEVDGRAGYYAGADIKWTAGHALRALHYDNRGDVSQTDAREPAWLTRFDSIGVRLELPADLTFIAQYLDGTTGVRPSADGRGAAIAEYWSWFGLLSYRSGNHRFTARHDRMATYTIRGEQYFEGEQDAHAWTAAYLFDVNAHWQIAAEVIRITGTLEQRTYLGQPVDAKEIQAQLAVRFMF